MWNKKSTLEALRIKIFITFRDTIFAFPYDRTLKKNWRPHNVRGVEWRTLGAFSPLLYDPERRLITFGVHWTIKEKRVEGGDWDGMLGKRQIIVWKGWQTIQLSDRQHWNRSRSKINGEKSGLIKQGFVRGEIRNYRALITVQKRRTEMSCPIAQPCNDVVTGSGMF
ncbi:hypothetical protein CEXT_232991 [Caerostris extrusa]|uniref:Uncharacterized protein n=1 Tax=Caerostris extrusa TaxID=172846 RepID=A0AAV4VJS1_CAEEX|nr:hypothetical protein CEXT_232991 [Caerostris extrusa]